MSIITRACVCLFVSLSAAAPLAAATLKVSSFPSGAQVSVDGVNTGKITPMNIFLPEGDHSVTVAIPGSGWNPDTRVVTIVSGNNDLSVTLLPVVTAGPPGPKGDKGDQGIQGPQGSAGTNGTDGTSVTFVDYFSGSTYQDANTGCPNGGAVYATGNPPVNAYVCNGTNGTRAAGPCFDNTNRYVDCGNGTVTDTVTGLIWLKQADCLVGFNYAAANQAAAGLKTGDCSLTDGSSPGDWRLPTKDEWSATIARAVALGCYYASPSLTNDAGTECSSSGTKPWFAGVAFGFYWSSSTDETHPDQARVVDLRFGDLYYGDKPDPIRVWPVRGGSR